MSGRLDGARVAFLQNSAINESLGLADLAGHLKSLGVRCRLFLEREEGGRLPERLRGFRPDLAVVPCDLLGHNAALRLARLIKRACPAPTLLGGTHPTFFPNVVLQEGVDYAFAGEAEGVAADLLDGLLAKRDPASIPNLILRDNGAVRANPLRPLAPVLDDLAMPDRDVYYRYRFLADFPWKKFATGRGCLNSCGYCFNPAYRSVVGSANPFFRRKSASRVVGEISEVRARHRLGIVHFSDDLFSSGRDWLESFAPLYRREVGLPFSCNVFASSLDDTTVRLLKNTGCRAVAIGVEVADDHVRRTVLGKPVSTAEIESAASRVRRAGIRLVTFNILGLPWSSLEGDLETLRLNRRIRSDHTRVAVLVPFPKSAVSERLVRDGLLVPDFEERIYEVEDLPRWPAERLFRRVEPTRTVRLYRLWPLLLRIPLPSRWMRSLVLSRWSSALAPLGAMANLVGEKRVFGIGWLAGLRYLLHAGSPALKTTNYVSFI